MSLIFPLSELENFAQTTYKLMHLLRYNIYPRIFPETVASHSYQVGILSLFLIEKYKKEYNIDELKILKLALIHDIGEVNGIDLPHPIKEKYPELNTITRESESEEIKNLLGEEYYKLFLEYNFAATVENAIVEIADAMSCLIYAQEEIKLGNTYFKRVENESKVRLDILNKELEVLLREVRK